VLKFGVMLRPGHFPFSHMLACMRVAEEAGFRFMWFGDSHLIWREPYVTMTACALGTSRVRLGTGVTNPLTRDVSVTASGFLALQELTRGRMALGIGLGDSAVRTMGARPVMLKTLESAIDQIRRLHRGETVQTPSGAQRLLTVGHLVGETVARLQLQVGPAAHCEGHEGHERGREGPMHHSVDDPADEVAKPVH